jgi:hypothetical protein
MNRKPDNRDNLHSVHSTRRPLAAWSACKCQHRAALAQDKIGAYSGNMKEVRKLSFKCTACGSVTNTLYMFHTQSEVDAFLAGKPEW